MSTVNNNGSAWGYGAWPTGDHATAWWVKIGPGVVGAPDYGLTFEVNLGGGDYIQLYLDIGSDPQYRCFQSFGGDALIRASGTFVGTWFKHLLTRVGNTWRLYIAEATDTSWTLVQTLTSSSTAPIGCVWASHVSTGSYVIEDASARSIRVYDTVHDLGDLLTDLDSATPTLGSVFARYMDGSAPSPSDFHLDQSGNLRHLMASGTAVPDADDPVSGGGGDIEADEEAELLRLRPGNYSTTLIAPPTATESTRQTPQDSYGAAAGTAHPARGVTRSTQASTMLGADLAADTTRQAALDFAVSQAALVTTQTERIRASYGPFSTGLDSAARKAEARPVSGTWATAAASSLPGEVVRIGAGDYSTGSAGVILAHTERLRTSTRAVATAQAVALPGDALGWRATGADSDLTQAMAPTESKWAAVTMTSDLSGTARGRTEALRQGDAVSVLAGQAASELSLVVGHDFSTSGSALVFASTQRLQTWAGGATSSMGAVGPREEQAFAAGDFSTAAGVVFATEQTEFTRVSPAGFETVFGTEQLPQPEHYVGGNVTTAWQTPVLATEVARQADNDYATSGDALLSAHTERLRTWSSSAAAAAENTQTGSSATGEAHAASAALGAAAATTRGRTSDGLSQSALVAEGSAEPVLVNGGIVSAHLGASGQTQSVHQEATDYTTGVVIFVAAHTEHVAPVPSDSFVTLGIHGSPLRVAMRSGGVATDSVGNLATEQLGQLLREYVTAVGTQQVNEYTERYVLRFGGYSAQVAVLPVTVTVYGAMGSGPFGTMPFGTALPTGSITPKRLLAVAANALLVPYPGATGAPGVNNPRSPNSALNPINWSIDAIDPQAMVRLPLRVFAVAAGQVVDGLPPATEEGFIIVFDAPLTQGAEYRLGQTPSSVNISPAMVPDRQFDALYIRCDAMPRDERDDDGSIRDIANPFLARDALQFPPALGTYQITDDGDLANDDGQASLRKRVIRRISATAGDFIHLPEYGAGIVGQVKQLRRIDTLQRMQAKIRAQVAKEPEITRCTVQVRPANGDSAVIVVAVTYWSVSNPSGETVVVPVAL